MGLDRTKAAPWSLGGPCQSEDRQGPGKADTVAGSGFPAMVRLWVAQVSLDWRFFCNPLRRFPYVPGRPLRTRCSAGQGDLHLRRLVSTE
jgi:hypothetical protein